MIVPVTDILVFGALVTAGLMHRRSRGTHKQLMLLATLGGLTWRSPACRLWQGGRRELSAARRFAAASFRHCDACRHMRRRGADVVPVDAGRGSYGGISR